MLAKIILIVLLNIYDLISTLALIKTGHFYEANPIMNAALQGFGPMGLVGVKLNFISFLILIYKNADKLELHRSKLMAWTLNSTVGIYLIVFTWQSFLIGQYLTME